MQWCTQGSHVMFNRQNAYQNALEHLEARKVTKTNTTAKVHLHAQTTAAHQVRGGPPFRAAVLAGTCPAQAPEGFFFVSPAGFLRIACFTCRRSSDRRCLQLPFGALSLPLAARNPKRGW